MRNYADRDHPALADLAARGRRKLTALGGDPPGRWLLVDVAGQQLILVRENGPQLVGPVSTALAGIDCRQDSGGTPSGLHRIADKIGAGEPAGTVFRSRRTTGEHWAPGRALPGDEDLILTRILTLEGLEEGHNRGPGVDSLERYIYIHGTNHEDRIGQPVSHGCVRMTSQDILELFEEVEVGDPVVIL